MKKNEINRREFLKLTSIAAAGAALAACTPKAAEVLTQATKGVPPPTEIPSVAATPMLKPSKLVAFTKEGDVSDGLKVCIDLVKQKTGITLEVQSAPEADFRAKVTADFAAGGGAYDLIFMPYAHMREFQSLGHLLPLDQYISDSPDINTADFIPALLKAYGGWNCGQWALPGKADVYINCYRKDVFNDPKIQDLFKARTGKELKPPQTVTDQLVIAEFLTKSINPDSPLTYGWTNWSEKLGIKWWWGPRMKALGGSYLDEKNHPGFNNEAGLQALKDCLAMHKFAPPDVATFNPAYLSTLASAQEKNTLLPLTGLCSAFPQDAEGNFLAYAEAASFTRFLEHQYGDPLLQSLIYNFCNMPPEVLIS